MADPVLAENLIRACGGVRSGDPGCWALPPWVARERSRLKRSPRHDARLCCCGWPA
jgi:hypothetical protein